MSKFMRLIARDYDAKEGGGLVPGAASLHNQMNGRGPDQATYEKATASQLKPHEINGTMAFMFETKWLEESNPEPPLLRTSRDERAIVRTMAALIGCDIHPLTILRVRDMLRSAFAAPPDQLTRWVRR